MVKKSVILLVKAYQSIAVIFWRQGPFFITSACRFHPSCSQYCLEAVDKYGPYEGLKKGFFRVARCNPLTKGGIDPVVDFPDNISALSEGYEYAQTLKKRY